MNLRSPRGWLPLLLVALGLALLLSLVAGTRALSPAELLAVLLGRPASPTLAAIVLKIRLPRALLAALVGSALGASGSAFQAVLRNPLADPYILGVSGGAALGAVAALTLGFSSPLLLPAAAFAGAAGALLLVYWVAQAHSGSPHTLILSGVMVGSLASALLLFLLWMAPADPVRTAVFWLAGNLALADPGWLPWAALWVGAAFCALWVQCGALDLLTQGEETAADLGLEVGRARLLLFAAAGGLTAAAVAMAGLVGFVGLTVPHVARLFWGASHRLLLPASALLGAVFLLLADTLSRTLLAPAEIPVGVVTALIGAPFFLFLLRRRQGGGE
ncbi:iron complex transport system permease protein [Geothermobacter ehrlichii]|uniref:Iron complex transport system permease protein n=1 Tax=Geothermobacter ehrlichii TaxID=213224 RepID=A0A5D3WJK4_9BACT|nr:iron ABC transporter permease [Geothermobacter ehrlichii]TYO97702.1 iron complex transport system permease protein [Geothermobacter ehrlichii]